MFQIWIPFPFIPTFMIGALCFKGIFFCPALIINLIWNVKECSGPCIWENEFLSILLIQCLVDIWVSRLRKRAQTKKKKYIIYKITISNALSKWGNSFYTLKNTGFRCINSYWHVTMLWIHYKYVGHTSGLFAAAGAYLRSGWDSGVNSTAAMQMFAVQFDLGRLSARAVSH